jgi:E3 ubiquitin-protein ligase HERC2
MNRQQDIVLRTQSRLDGKWVKTDLQGALSPDGLAQLWNEMVKDGELSGLFSDGLINAVGVTSRKGRISILAFFYSNQQGCAK